MALVRKKRWKKEASGCLKHRSSFHSLKSKQNVWLRIQGKLPWTVKLETTKSCSCHRTWFWTFFAWCFRHLHQKGERLGSPENKQTKKKNISRFAAAAGTHQDNYRYLFPRLTLSFKSEKSLIIKSKITIPTSYTTLKKQILVISIEKNKTKLGSVTCLRMLTPRDVFPGDVVVNTTVCEGPRGSVALTLPDSKVSLPLRDRINGNLCHMCLFRCSFCFKPVGSSRCFGK